MLRRVFVAVVVVVALVGLTLPAYAHHHHHRHHHKHHHSSSDSGGGSKGDSSKDDSSGDGTSSGDTSGSTDMATTPDSAMSDTAAPAATGAEKLVTFKITGFGAKDNTPPGSTTISMPVIHKQAGGTGTFADPLTAATPGHSGKGTESPKGTKFYIPGISRYVIVEDSGATKFSQPHLDIWSGTTDNVEDCEGKITKTEQIIENPGPGHPVKAGPIATEGGCNI